MSSARTVAHHCGLAVTKRAVCDVPTMAGSTTSRDKPSRCRPSLRGSTFCAHVKLASYPLIKIGDVLWTYMGDPPANQPPLPEFEFALVPADQTFTSKRWQECNWLQAFEGGIDSSHVSFLHSGGAEVRPAVQRQQG